MATLTIVRAGILTTVQDLGRAGWGAFGVPASGAMDVLAARAANQLAGNPPGAAVLELTGPGAALTIDEARVVAVAGADLDGQICGEGDARPLPPFQPAWFPPGSTLRFARRRGGARAALAIAGGLDVAAVLGSASTDVGNRLGGWQGRALRAGDRLALGPAPAPDAPLALAFPADAVAAVYDDPFRIRFLPAPGATPALGAWLEATPFSVTPQSNRVGFRLRAEGAAPPVDAAGGERLSEPIAPGAIQLPPDGQPILLMADRQTIGGYAVAGHVIAADLSRAAQLWPGDRFRFAAVAPAEARRLLLHQAAAAQARPRM